MNLKPQSLHFSSEAVERGSLFILPEAWQSKEPILDAVFCSCVKCEVNLTKLNMLIR
jgi:hypothetical protein